ncbi:HEAT repeat protein [Planctomycetes bacterium Pan216]|uniref:HEAT repeat protein n=1 Tax=Kolteria novifilia TaxID=2527975 RepID=A0A518B4J4_9BACT|nr:HEAT repeat protein [Planctomycetes bacterium Pan216]
MSDPRPRRVNLLLLGMALTLAQALGAWAADDSKVTEDLQVGEALPETRLMLFVDGSALVRVEGEEHRLGPSEVDKELPRLLKDQSRLLLEMEDWKGFERFARQRLAGLHDLGVREMVARIEDNGEVRTRVFPLRPPTLADRVTSSDSSKRAAALDEVAAMLAAEDPSDHAKALLALRRANRYRFDGSRFLSTVRKFLDDGNHVDLSLRVLPVIGGDKSDVPRVLTYADAQDPRLRMLVPGVLYAIDPQASDAAIFPAVEKLLHDENGAVVTATYKSLWGKPSTPAMEERLVELSRHPTKGREVLYYALATRPLLRRVVAERLIEALEQAKGPYQRAVWGLRKPATDDAHPLVVDGLIRELGKQVDSRMRREAIMGLRAHGGPKAIDALNAIASNPNETETSRGAATEALKRLGAPIPELHRDPAGVAADHGSSQKELWKQLAQSNDPQLKRQALKQVTSMLERDAQRGAALQILAQAHDAVFDRSSLIPLVKPMLSSEQPLIRARALLALATMGDDALDRDSLSTFAKDESPFVREAVAKIIVHVDPKAQAPSTAKTVETLLNDEDRDVLLAMIRSSWGYPTSPAAEKRMIELSFDSRLGDDAIYYALSTRPLMRPPVVERLGRLIDDTPRHRGRSIWGLSHHSASDAARDLVVTELIDVIDESADSYDRGNAIDGLGFRGGDKAKKRLEEILDSPDESAWAKERARQALGKSNDQ